MSRTYIAKELRERVAADARHRCGYCLTAEAIVGTAMEIDHLIPESLGGLTVKENLWLACVQVECITGGAATTWRAACLSLAPSSEWG
jgi:5-methylcytosine-specific restriction endonuclease McrA